MEGFASMFFGHQGLEIGRGVVLGTALMLAPFHKQTVGDATEHSENEDTFVALDPAAIVIVGDIQPLMQATFDPPALAVEEQPWQSLEPFRLGAANQSDFFVFSALSLAQQSGGLRGKGKSDVFRCDGSGANDSILMTPFVLLLSTSLSWRGLFRGENPLEERRPCFGCWPAEWAGSFWR